MDAWLSALIQIPESQPDHQQAAENNAERGCMAQATYCTHIHSLKKLDLKKRRSRSTFPLVSASSFTWLRRAEDEDRDDGNRAFRWSMVSPTSELVGYY
jgi:hypothetical protein